MAGPLDLDGVRERLTFAEAIRLVDDKPDHPVYESQQDVEPLLAEIARLRATADPLERLEAWANGDGNETRRYVVSQSWAGVVTVGLYVLEVGKGLEFGGANMASAITAALDLWDSREAQRRKGEV